jgi:hypothetical protein
MAASPLPAPRDPQAPMSVSDIIKTGWRLYVANFSQYLVISLIATAWSLVPTVFYLVTISPISLGLSAAASIGISVLVFVVGLALSFYCTAQSLGQFAGISRLAYQSLSNSLEANEPEAFEEASAGADAQSTRVRTALRFTRSRKFSFLGAAILQGLILILTSLALGLGLVIVFSLTALAFSAIAGETWSTGLNILFLLLLLGLFLVFVGAYLYVYARFMLFEQPLAIEQNADVFGTLARSWELTKHGVRRAMLVAFLLSLFALIVILVFLVPLSAVLIPNSDIATILSAENPDPDLLAQALLPFYAALFVISTAIGVGLMPLFKTTFTTLYFDLRNRFERRAFRESSLNQSVE